MSRSVFRDNSRILTWILSAIDESSISGTVSISISVSISRLSLVLALKDHSNAGGVSSMPRKFSVTKIPLNLSLNIFGSKNLPVCFVKRSHLSQL